MLLLISDVIKKICSVFFISMMLTSAVNAIEKEVKLVADTVDIDVSFDKSVREVIFKATLTSESRFNEEQFIFLMGDKSVNMASKNKVNEND